jgi:hypothetical protein
MGTALGAEINTACLTVPQASTCCGPYTETYRPSTGVTALDISSYRHELHGIK